MKTASFLISATTALLFNFIPNTYAYDDIYVFGDSLSDGGNIGRFTTDGKNAELYDEYISQQITGKKLTPSKNKGNNYALGRALANGFGPTTQNQLNSYLQKHGNHADPNDVYIHWVGGNDINNVLEFKHEHNDKEAEKTINDSSAAAASQVNQLIKAGAGLIIVPNIPDIGTTPRIMEAVLKGALEKREFPDKKINEILQDIHKKINKYLTPNAAVRNQVIQGVFKDIANEASPKDPKEAQKIYNELLDAYNKNSQIASQFVDQYNQKEEEQFSKGNILRADVNLLLKEVIDNPLIYGVTNTLGYACPQGKLAIFCSSGIDKSQSFLFSDDLHPTPDAHKIIGQYIMSIYNAPFQVMVLNQANRLPVKNVLAYLDTHLQQLRNARTPKGKIGIFGGYTDNGDNTFTLGSDYQLTDNFLLGATLSHYRKEQSSISDFSYDGRGYVLAAYGLWNYNKQGWLSGDVHYSRTHYDSLIRSIQLGQALRTESGTTSGKQWGWRITAGWTIPVTDYLSTSPILQYAWDKGGVYGYRESGNSSSAMHFSAQGYQSRIGSMGWRIDTQLGRFNPYALILFNHQFNDERNSLYSAINNTKTIFVQQGEKPDNNNVQYTVGVNANLTKDFHAFAEATHKTSDKASNRDYDFSFGLSVSF
ncbi:autotransporter outer membrane beta-barrel domain-containing protein [Xenorhabdus szentirmaii]|uniref:autotransporter outer membrane beta-barrel domain-containing protein n=1 Tax=Xenorhabdus szentirmaii TaxID=290112 RepID=UPI0019A91E50|nr:autotransporter domain-containing protein [Xenorhabdus sp. 38]MBD2781836.1 autotransporter domain-containing protein [Xenorhabdus sp. 38]